MVNSREKGARFERKLAAILTDYGFPSRRGQQYCGANGDADVVGLPGIHIEAKHQERLNIHEWIKQAVRDAKGKELPAVFHKKNGEDILVTMRLKDWITIYREYHAYIEIDRTFRDSVCEERCRYYHLRSAEDERGFECDGCPINTLGGGCYGN